MQFIVVMRDHAGDWHCVGGPSGWAIACVEHRVAAYTLSATDYYDDCPPTVLKIICNDGTPYADAEALAEPRMSNDMPR